MAGNRIVSRAVKITFEELLQPELCEISVDNQPAKIDHRFRADPRPPRYEIHFKLSEDVVPGYHQVDIRVGQRTFPPVWIEVPAGDVVPTPH